VEKKSFDFLMTCLGIFWLGMGFGGLILAFLGLFYWQFLFFYFIFWGIAFGYFLKKKSFRLFWNKEFSFILALSFVVVLIFSFFSTPSIFTGRDQGSFSNAAIALSQNHSVKFSFPAQKEFFQIYGPGKALNFPGFDYTKNGELVSHFLFGYIVWLAIFYSFLGLGGLIFANALAFFLFLLSFYAIARNYLSFSSALTAFFLIISSFVFSWFFRYTLSENLALFLVWFGIFQFLLLRKKNLSSTLAKWGVFLSFGFLFFTRIESIAFIFVLAVIFYVQRKKDNFKNIFILKSILSPLLLLGGIFWLSFPVHLHFYASFAKGFLKSVGFLGGNLGEKILEGNSVLNVFRLAETYSFLSFLFLGFGGFFYFLKKKQLNVLIPYFILLPSFFYLINPAISSDHPWMLRRFVFSIIPVSILLSVIFLDVFFQKKKWIFFVLSGTLLVFNLTVTWSSFRFQENKNLMFQIEKISQKFSPQDLILVDRLATGDGWSMMAGPLNTLLGKQAVYFFNPDDLEKINQKKFSRIFLIIPDENLKNYQEKNWAKKMIPIENYALENNHLTSESKNNFEFPVWQTKNVRGKIYLLNKK